MSSYMGGIISQHWGKVNSEKTKGYFSMDYSGYFRYPTGMKQLNKVVEVLKVVDLTETQFLDRETALIKVHTRPEHRDEAIRLADIFRAKIVDSSPSTYTIEITGDVEKVEAMINMLQPLGIKELIRTGRIAISRETTHTASPRREPALLKT